MAIGLVGDDSMTGLRDRVLRAGGWTVAGQLLSQLIRLGSNLLLARWLAPDAFGLMAVVTILMTGLLLFSDLGIGRTLIQSPNADKPEMLDTAFTVQVLRGAGMGLLMIVLGGALWLAASQEWSRGGTVYADPRLPALVMSFSIVCLLTGCETVRIVIAKRQMQLSTLVKIDLASQIFGALLLIGVAWQTRSIWAMVVAAIAAAAMRIFLGHLVLPGHRERLRLVPEAWKEIVHVGKWMMLSSIVTFVAMNGDRLFLASLLDSHALGLYAIAYLITNAIQVFAYLLSGNVAYPAISHVHRERPQDLANTLTKFQWAYDALVVTLFAILAASGPALISLLYGPRYAGSGWMLTVLAIGAIGMRTQVVEHCFVTLGRPQLTTVVNLLRLGALVLGIHAGHAVGGLEGAIIGIAASQYAGWPVAIWFELRHKLWRWRSEFVAPLALVAGGSIGLLIAQMIQHWRHV